MNAPWQPPTDGESGRPDLSSPGPSDERTDSSEPAAPPSPWSAEGSRSWADDAATEAPLLPPPPSSSSVPSPDGLMTPPMGAPDTDTDTDTGSGSGADSPPAVAPGRKRSKLVVAGAAVAVGALGLAGLFAVQQFSGQSAGGAETADELGADLLAAIEAEDVLGVIDTLVPGERDSLGEPFVEMVGELQRLEILSADTDLSQLLGLDVELTGETVRVRGTNVPDIVNVELEAEVTVTVDGAALPIGSFIEDQLTDDALTELRNTRETETDELSLELTAVLDGDRWYFSVFHTIAELARAETGDEPIPAEGVVPDGGDSPEAAVDRLLDRIEQLDVRGVIAILDPAEAAALQRYAPLFLDEVEAELAEVPLEWRIDVREFRVEGSGGERTVFVDAIGISGEAEGSEFSLGFDGGCVRGEFDGESFEECGSAGDEELASLFEDSPAIEEFAATLEEAFADLEPIGLELRERDGAWYVSPFATGTEAFLAVMRALDRSELDQLVEDGTAAADEFFDVFLGGFGFGFEDEWVEDEWVEDEWVEDDGFDDSAADPTRDAWDECYALSTATDAAACFERYVASGEIEAYSVPAALLHPECGMAELTWEGGLTSATDEEFGAALGTAVPCFQALIDSGELEDWMLPFEVSYAECFEGRNWYAEFEDAEYNERVDACIAETD